MFETYEMRLRRQARDDQAELVQRGARSSKSYEDEGAHELWNALPDPQVEEETAVQTTDKVIFQLGDDHYEIEPVVPSFWESIKYHFGWRQPEVVVTRVYKKTTKKYETADIWMRGGPPIAEDTGSKRIGSVVAEGTNFSGVRAEADRDVAVQALRRERVTSNKEFWKELQKAKKAPQEITLRVPRGHRLTADQKKELKTIFDKLVRGMGQRAGDNKLKAQPVST